MRLVLVLAVIAMACAREEAKPAPAPELPTRPAPAPEMAAKPAPADAAPAEAAAADAAPSEATIADAVPWLNADPHCPRTTALALAHALARRWQSPVTDGEVGDGGGRLDGSNTAWLIVSCVGGTFVGKPGFFVEARDNRFVGTARRQVRHRVVVDAAGSDLVPGLDTDAAELSRFDDHDYYFATADLDGDGNDEVLVTDDFRHNDLAAGLSVTALAVARTGITELKPPITIRSSGTMWPSCDGVLTREPASKAVHLVLTAAATNTNDSPRGPCPTPGRHVFALVRGMLVEAK